MTQFKVQIYILKNFFLGLSNDSTISIIYQKISIHIHLKFINIKVIQNFHNKRNNLTKYRFQFIKENFKIFKVKIVV